MVTKIESSENRAVRGLATPRGLTVEVCLHIAIVVVGFAMRLAALAKYPLLGSEAGTALAAWRGMQGQLWRPEIYSPLLYDINLLFFALVGGSDGLVRIASALAGTALVGLPFMVRDILGRRGALAAALMLAVSPFWLFFSRTADGQILVALALSVALFAWWHHRQHGDDLSPRVGWIALALAMVSGAGAYTLILAGALGGLLLWLRARRSSEGVQQDSAPWQALRAIAGRENLLLFVGVLVVAASGLGLNPSGIGAAVSLAGHWVASLWPSQGALPWYSLLRNLVAYEPLIVVLALLATVLGFLRREKLDQALAWWAAVALLLGTLLGHRDGQWLLCSLLPMTLLAARGLERLCASIELRMATYDWAMLWAGLCLFALAFLQLAAHIQNGQSDVAWLAAFALGLLALSLAAYGFWLGGGAVTRVSVVLVIVLLAMCSVHTSVSLNYRTGRQAHETLVSEPTSLDMARFSDLVSETSLNLRRDEHAAIVHYDASLDPVIGWYLREMPNAMPVTYADGLSGADMLVTELRTPERYPDGYAAQRLALSRAWPQQGLTLREKLRWLIYRDDVGWTVPTEVQLWIKLATESSLQP